MGHPTIPDDILAAAEDLIPRMDLEPGKNMRGCMVYYAAMGIKQERERCAKVVEDNLDEDPDFLMGLLIRIRSPSTP